MTVLLLLQRYTFFGVCKIFFHFMHLEQCQTIQGNCLTMQELNKCTFFFYQYKDIFF